MKKDLHIRVYWLLCCLFLVACPINNYAGQNSSAGCSLDMDYTTQAYTNEISTVDIETNVFSTDNNDILIGVIAQNVKDLDTYQVEIKYDPNVLKLIDVSEDIPMKGIINILKQNNGRTIGFQSTLKKSGIINISNTLVGSDSTKSANGSGVIAVLKFKVLSDVSTSLELSNVRFVDSLQKEDHVVKVNGANCN